MACASGVCQLLCSFCGYGGGKERPFFVQFWQQEGQHGSAVDTELQSDLGGPIVTRQAARCILQLPGGRVSARFCSQGCLGPGFEGVTGLQLCCVHAQMTAVLSGSCMYPPRICSSHRPASTLVGNLPLLLKVQPHAIGMRVDWHVHSWSARMGRLRLALRAFAHRRQQLKGGVLFICLRLQCIALGLPAGLFRLCFDSRWQAQMRITHTRVFLQEGLKPLALLAGCIVCLAVFTTSAVCRMQHTLKTARWRITGWRLWQRFCSGPALHSTYSLIRVEFCWPTRPCSKRRQLQAN